jgi:hypothetical protein
MLLEKPKEVPYIAIFKTAAGEEFIARVVDETIMGYKVEKPLCMVATETGLRFAPFLMMADPDKTISIPKPIITGTPENKLEEQYKQATSSIALPRRN